MTKDEKKKISDAYEKMLDAFVALQGGKTADCVKALQQAIGEVGDVLDE